MTAALQQPLPTERLVVMPPEEATATTETALEPEAFRAVFRRHPAGVAVVAFDDGNRPHAFTATSVISVSAEPPLIAFSVVATSASGRAIGRARSAAVSFLADGQADVARRCAERGADRVRDISWTRLSSGDRVVDGVGSWLRGRVVSVFPVGASLLVVVHVLEARPGEESPLLYHDRTYRLLGPPIS